MYYKVALHIITGLERLVVSFFLFSIKFKKKINQNFIIEALKKTVNQPCTLTRDYECQDYLGLTCQTNGAQGPNCE